MPKLQRLTALVCTGIAASMLTACATGPYGAAPYGTTTGWPSTTTPYPTATYPVAGMEYGRIVNIEYLPAGTNLGSNTNNVLGAVVGGLVGGVLGNQIGGGSGRTAATVLGGVAGAAVGSHIARNQSGVTTAPGYRITMRSDQGVMRVFEVPATGDLRIGDRVRVDNGVIYRA